MIEPDDPRITAYALGEADDADRRAVEETLACDPAVGAAVEEARAWAARLTEAFEQECRVGLGTARREAVLARASAAATPVRRLSPWRWAPLGLATGGVAATLLAVLTAGSGGGGGGLPASAAREGRTKGAESGAPDGLQVHARAPVAEASVRLAGLTAPANARGTLDVRVRSQPEPQVGLVVAPGAPLPLPPPAGPGAGPTVSTYLSSGDVGIRPRTVAPAGGSGEDYEATPESPFLRAADAPLSTFSVDVDTASYANVRRMLVAGQWPPADAVRVEEMVNYFPYDYAPPAGADPFAVHVEVAACPWNLGHRLVLVGLKGREVARAARPPMNLVFLLDVSGSMDQPDKLPLVQASMRMLLEELNERDTVAIVVYAGASGVVLPPTSCERKTEIQRAIDGLRAGGSTNGAAGIQLAYQVAAQGFLKDGVNRVVLATDGDFNVGVTSPEDLLRLVTEKARSGVFLTCLGYGMGNLKDSTLEMLADKGNGNYGYVDSTREARKVLVEGASGTLVTIAKDVKVQVEFNPARVAAYRLVGYDDRRLQARDFADDRKDAGEIGAGHTVTALYEVVPVGAKDAPTSPPAPEVDPLRYAPKPATAAPAPPPAPATSGVSAETLAVKLRFKQPDGDGSVERQFPLTDAGASYEMATPDFKFAASVAAFALLLKASPFVGNASLETVAELAGEGLGYDPGGYRREFTELVARARAMRGGR